MPMFFSRGRARSALLFSKVKREAAARRRPARSERKTGFFPRRDRPYGVKRNAFHTENALEDARTGELQRFIPKGAFPCGWIPAGAGAVLRCMAGNAESGRGNVLPRGVLERFNSEKGETRGGDAAPPRPK